MSALGQGPVLNNVKWQLDSFIAYNDTAIEIPFGTNGYSDMWDMLNTGYYFLLTFVTETEETNHEIVKVTPFSEPFVYIERGMEGTTPQDWVLGSRVEMRLTRDTMRRHKEIGDRYLLTADGRLLTGIDDELLLGPEPNPLPDLY